MCIHVLFPNEEKDGLSIWVFTNIFVKLTFMSLPRFLIGASIKKVNKHTFFKWLKKLAFSLKGCGKNTHNFKGNKYTMDVSKNKQAKKLESRYKNIEW